MKAVSELIAFIAGKWSVFILAMQASAIARRLIFVAWLGGLYVACVVAFTTTVSPWFSAITSSGAYGAVLGLLFPPISGTVLGYLVVYWGTVAALRYTTHLSKIAFKD